MRDRLFQIVLALMLLAASVGCTFLAVTTLRHDAPIWFGIAAVGLVLTLAVAFVPIGRLPIPHLRVKWEPWDPPPSTMFTQWMEGGDPVPEMNVGLGGGRGHQYTVRTQGKVDRISFTAPFQGTVRESELPVTISFRWKRFDPKPEVTVLDFTDSGVVLDDKVPEAITASFLFYRVPADPPG